MGNGLVQCMLCPHHCLLKDGKYGKCHVRVNRDGTLATENYGMLSAIASDPIEKKPLYHFLPGKPILSIGSYGCNLSCDFCQNCDISQVDPGSCVDRIFRGPEGLVSRALLQKDNIGLAYTYNEPTVYYEYMVECASRIKEHGKYNVMVTNGYINPSPLESLLPLIDAFNVDLKSFRDEFYSERSGAGLKPVLETISRIAKSDRHLEITFLLIPGCNDREEEWQDMIHWITEHCGRETILHVSRYFPRFKLRNPPTPLEQMERFLEIARESIRYVYAGNAPHLETHTYCPVCGNMLVRRSIYQALVSGISDEGCCRQCNHRIKGRFN